jgi:naphthoate synthase
MGITMAKTVGITEEELYAAVNWRDESSHFEDI